MAEAKDRKLNVLIEKTADLVVAYVSHNPVPQAELPALIARIYAAISGLGTGTGVELVPPAQPKPANAAQIRKSLGQDGIVSFIDGRSYKTLKRHLTANGLTPERYRERYGLPADYPMVAPSYAEQRSALAKAIGLGVPGAYAERQGSARASA